MKVIPHYKPKRLVVHKLTLMSTYQQESPISFMGGKGPEHKKLHFSVFVILCKIWPEDKDKRGIYNIWKICFKREKLIFFCLLRCR